MKWILGSVDNVTSMQYSNHSVMNLLSPAGPPGWPEHQAMHCGGLDYYGGYGIPMDNNRMGEQLHMYNTNQACMYGKSPSPTLHSPIHSQQGYTLTNLSSSVSNSMSLPVQPGETSVKTEPDSHVPGDIRTSQSSPAMMSPGSSSISTENGTSITPKSESSEIMESLDKRMYIASNLFFSGGNVFKMSGLIELIKRLLWRKGYFEISSCLPKL